MFDMQIMVNYDVTRRVQNFKTLKYQINPVDCLHEELSYTQCQVNIRNNLQNVQVYVPQNTAKI